MNKEIVIGLLKQGKFNHLSSKARILINKTGKCPGGYNVHHIVPQSEGGSSELSNLIPLKQSHHNRVHDDDRLFTEEAKIQGLVLRKDRAYWERRVIKTCPNRDREYKKNLILQLQDGYKSSKFIKKCNGGR